MDVRMASDYDEMSLLAADEVCRVVEAKPGAVLGLTTGFTPAGVYRELVRRVRAGGLDLSRTLVFSMDEYLGLAPESPISLHAWLRRSLLEPAGIPRSRVVGIGTGYADPQEACQRYDDHLAVAGGFDLVLVAIGVNGHVGFNEPGSAPLSPSRVVMLARSTRRSNFGYWNREVPASALTTGLRWIIGSRRILLLAAGREKCEALHRSLSGDPSPAIPASLLRSCRDLKVIADKEALPAWPPREGATPCSDRRRSGAVSS